MATIKWMKKVESTVIDPIRSFLQVDVANLKVPVIVSVISSHHANINHRMLEETWSTSKGPSTD